MKLGVRALKMNPKFQAAETNTPLSEWAWYSNLPVKITQNIMSFNKCSKSMMGKTEVYELLCILDFNNARKRMLVILAVPVAKSAFTVRSGLDRLRPPAVGKWRHQEQNPRTFKCNLQLDYSVYIF